MQFSLIIYRRVSLALQGLQDCRALWVIQVKGCVCIENLISKCVYSVCERGILSSKE